MIIGHLSAYSKASANGVIQVVYNMSNEEVRQGHKVYVFGYKDGLSSVETTFDNGVCLKLFPKGKKSQGHMSEEFLKYLEDNPDHLDVMHFHSVYTLMNNVAAKHCSMPYVVTPHGGYSLANLKRDKANFIKKSVYNFLVEKKYLRNACMVQALNEREKEELVLLDHSLGEKTVVVSNGITQPSIPTKDHIPSDVLRFTFIGRLDVVHKGLDIMLAGFSKFCRACLWGGTRLSLIGPADEQTKEYLNNQIAELELEDVVFVEDAMFGTDKDNFLRNSTDIFIHTSRWEGTPIAVLEALSYGLPVLISEETNLGKEVSEYNAGWVMKENTPNGLCNTLLKIREDIDSYPQYQANARRLSESEFTWNKVVNNLVGEILKRLDK